MKRFELIKTMDLDTMQMFLYHNSRHTKKGMKKLKEWLEEEVTEEELEKYGK